MTFNWGHKLTLAFIAFAALMMFMVYKTTQANFELVSKEYYKDELAYQQVIDGTNLANKLSSLIEIQQQNELISVQLPQEMKMKEATGTIYFYCPSEASKDRKLNINLNEEAVHLIPAGTILPGNYIVKINWQAEQQNYYNEQAIIIK